jgi:aminopeptidase
VEVFMTKVTIPTEALETWAGYLLDHSLGGITAEDRVMIKGESICWPLIEVLERRIIEAGGVPDVLLVPPNNDRGRVWSAAMARSGSAEQLERIPEWHRARYESMTKYIEVLGASDPTSYADLDASQNQALAGADRPFANIRIAKPWVLTLYPTQGFADLEGLDLETYADFIVRASTEDPMPLKTAEEKIAPLLDTGREMTIVTVHPDDGRELTLTLDLQPSIAVMSYGLRNFPDGEVFTSPDARRSEGELYLDLTVNYGGKDIQGIYLKFEKGIIVDYSARVGHEALAAIIETDDGSHRLGEVALGMNAGMERVLKHPLFVEKVGGTLHVAIGMSYETCYVTDPSSAEGRARLDELTESGALNRSAQHVDIVADFRPGGCGRRVEIDGVRLVPKDGFWVVADGEA